MTRFVALLQGVNLGAKRRIAMPALRDSMEDLGLYEVRTYIQSGNVVFSSPLTSPETLAADIRSRIRSDFGLDVPVLVRTYADLQRIVASNPFLPGESDLTRLHVTFLEGIPTDVAIAHLGTLAFPPDEFRVRGSEIFVRHVNGVSRSSIDFAVIARTLGITGMTSRNWRTVTRLAEMSREQPGSA